MEPEVTQPIVDPNTQPGGQSYEHMRTLQTQTAESNTALKAQVAQLEAANAQLATPPPTSTPSQTTNEGASVESFDWDKGLMRTEDGKVNPTLISALKRAGMTEQHVTNLLGYTEDGALYRTHLNETLIKDTAGTKEDFDAYVNWGRENMTTQDYSSMAASLNDRNTNKFAMRSLMDMAKEGGFTIGNQTPAPTNAPSTLPQSSAGGGSVSPLRSTDPGYAQEIAAAYSSKDPAKITLVNQRVAAGLK